MDTSALARELLETMPLMGRVIEATIRDLHHRQHHDMRPPIFPPHVAVLKALARRLMTQGELAMSQQVGPSTMSATIDALVRRGWVMRLRNEADRRIAQIEITAEGRRVLAQFEEPMIESLRGLLDTLTEAELTDLQAGLAVMRRLFEQSASAPIPPPPDMRPPQPRHPGRRPFGRGPFGRRMPGAPPDAPPGFFRFHERDSGPAPHDAPPWDAPPPEGERPDIPPLPPMV
ncbi:MAG: MarR family transcriptional regulator [Anaerolineae bacterium]